VEMQGNGVVNRTITNYKSRGMEDCAKRLDKKRGPMRVNKKILRIGGGAFYAERKNVTISRRTCWGGGKEELDELGRTGEWMG